MTTSKAALARAYDACNVMRPSGAAADEAESSMLSLLFTGFDPTLQVAATCKGFRGKAGEATWLSRGVVVFCCTPILNALGSSLKILARRAS